MSKKALAVHMLVALLVVGCVTRTERVAYYPYARPQEEGILDELRRELAWKKSPSRKSGESFYERATRWVTSWFREEKPSMSPEEIAEDRRRFERKRQDALRRLQEQEEVTSDE